MELTKNHRLALINQLNEVAEAIELKKAVIKSFENKGDNDMAEYSSMDLYLLETKKGTIEAAIANNEIDW